MLSKNILQNTLHEDAEKVPVRNGFGEGLVEVAKENEAVWGLCADLTDSTRMRAFADAFPERYVEIGIAEQNLAVVASGLASCGKIPFITSYATFSPGRNWEQIRTTICYNNMPVKIVGSHAGISVGPDGGTHQAIEDIAIMRVLPNMEVVVPCDVHEARRATIAIADTGKPAYIRLARNKTAVITTPETPFELGKAYELWRSKKVEVAIIGCGPLLHEALKAAEMLEHDGIGTVVLNSHTIKPLDDAQIIALAKEAGKVLVIEEHQQAGGLGSAVAELLAQHAPVKMAFVGVDDAFGQSGTPEELIEQYELDARSIVKKVKSLIR